MLPFIFLLESNDHVIVAFSIRVFTCVSAKNISGLDLNLLAKIFRNVLSIPSPSFPSPSQFRGESFPCGDNRWKSISCGGNQPRKWEFVKTNYNPHHQPNLRWRLTPLHWPPTYLPEHPTKQTCRKQNLPKTSQDPQKRRVKNNNNPNQPTFHWPLTLLHTTYLPWPPPYLPAPPTHLKGPPTYLPGVLAGPPTKQLWQFAKNNNNPQLSS